jgi:hypothetical protein
MAESQQTSRDDASPAVYVKRAPPPDKVKMRIGVIGSLLYTNYDDFEAHMATYMRENDLERYTAEQLQFNGGGTVGTDAMLERWCTAHGHTLRAARPDVNAYVREAAFQRNRQLAHCAQQLLIFFDAANRDERDLKSGLEVFRKQQKPVKLVYVECDSRK